jgi:hypothetical protein
MPRSAAPVIACRKILCDLLSSDLEDTMTHPAFEEYERVHLEEAVRIVKNALARTHG